MLVPVISVLTYLPIFFSKSFPTTSKKAHSRDSKQLSTFFLLYLLYLTFISSLDQLHFQPVFNKTLKVTHKFCLTVFNLNICLYCKNSRLPASTSLKLHHTTNQRKKSNYVDQEQNEHKKRYHFTTIVEVDFLVRVAFWGRQAMGKIHERGKINSLKCDFHRARILLFYLLCAYAEQIKLKKGQRRTFGTGGLINKPECSRWIPGQNWSEFLEGRFSLASPWIISFAWTPYLLKCFELLFFFTPRGRACHSLACLTTSPRTKGLIITKKAFLYVEYLQWLSLRGPSGTVGIAKADFQNTRHLCSSVHTMMTTKHLLWHCATHMRSI